MNKDKREITVLGVLYSILSFTLFVEFLRGKLWGAISWSWWVVTLPLWALPAAFIAFIAVIWIIYAACLLVDKIKRTRRIKAIQRGQRNGK